MLDCFNNEHTEKTMSISPSSQTEVKHTSSSFLLVLSIFQMEEEEIQRD